MGAKSIDFIELQDGRGELSGGDSIDASAATSRTVTSTMGRQKTSTDSDEADEYSREDQRQTKQQPQHMHGHLQHEISYSKPIYLEPPPVVRRPPKIKNDEFSVTSHWFSWRRSEQSDGLYCARSIHKLYAYESDIRLFGIKFSRKLDVEFSHDDVNYAQERLRIGKQEWNIDRLPEARHRLAKYTHNQRKEIDAAAAREASESHVDLRQKGVADLEGQNGADVNGATSAPPTTEASNAEQSSMHRHPYIVVGFMGDESVPKETLRRIIQPDHLFKELHAAHRHLRKPHRRLFSLKECAGFGIYECDPTKGYHRELPLDRETERTLAEMWRSFQGHKLDYEGRWMNWIHQNFNNESNNPEEGKFTLEFKLRWSVYKVVIWGIIPVLLSLAIGFWYMYGADHGDVTDKVAIAEAAWVIASYIVTTSALLLALLAVVSQFGYI